MRRVFVDTSAFFAHLVAEDTQHARARDLFERASRESWSLISTNAVVWETYTLLRIRARNGREPGLGFLEDIEDGLCDIERVRHLDEARAIDLLKQHADKKYSFCDALSFVVMEQTGVTEALAFDDDFRSYGKIRRRQTNKQPARGNTTSSRRAVFGHVVPGAHTTEVRCKDEKCPEPSAANASTSF